MTTTAIIAKTPETLTIEARRALATGPLQYALSGDAWRVLIAIRTATRQIHRTPDGEAPRAQRFVALVAVRVMLDMPTGRVDRALRELAGVYAVWLRAPFRDTSLAEDNAAVRRSGQDYHDVSADDPRDLAA